MNGLSILAGLGTFTILCIGLVHINAWVERWWR